MNLNDDINYIEVVVVVVYVCITNSEDLKCKLIVNLCRNVNTNTDIDSKIVVNNRRCYACSPIITSAIIIRSRSKCSK